MASLGFPASKPLTMTARKSVLEETATEDTKDILISLDFSMLTRLNLTVCSGSDLARGRSDLIKPFFFSFPFFEE